MNNAYTIITMLAIGAAAGLTGMFLAESYAWHQHFDSKKDCTDFFKNGGNTNKEANLSCQKLLPH